jgi:hypothetical protein
VETKYCNACDLVRGGMLAALALGYTTSLANNTPLALLTINLTLNYAGR